LIKIWLKFDKKCELFWCEICVIKASNSGFDHLEKHWNILKLFD